MKTIELTRGKVALVDDADFVVLSQYSWCTKRDGHQFYAHRSKKQQGKTITTMMHRQITGLAVGNTYQVDHINGDGLDNRRENLRICSKAQNVRNSRKYTGLHRYKGVAFYHGRPNKSWQARIRVEGKLLSLGYFVSQVDAAAAYDVAALFYWGEYAGLNFPDNDYAALLRVSGIRHFLKQKKSEEAMAKYRVVTDA